MTDERDEADEAGAGGRRGRGRPRSADVDRTILAAALELFADQGVDGVTIDGTAKLAGVTRATVYRRWPTTTALLARALESLRAEVETDLGAWHDRPVDDILRWFEAAVPDALAEPSARRLIAHLIGSTPTNPDLMGTYWDGVLRPRREAFAAILERAAESGAIREDVDAEVVMDMLAGALLVHVLVGPRPTTAPDIRAYLQRVLAELGLHPA